MLVLGLRPGEVVEAARSLVAIDLVPPRPSPTPSPTPPPRPSAKSAPKGDPGQRNLKNKATQIVAVKPPIVIVKPPPVVVATTPANVGNATQSGMSDRPGPGQGAGNYGNGLGGGGDGDGVAVDPRAIRDRLSIKDLPQDLAEPGSVIEVTTDFIIQPDGHPTNCRVTQSSGYPSFDRTVCALIERRFLYRPALNKFGRPVPMHALVNHSWRRDPKDW